MKLKTFVPSLIVAGVLVSIMPFLNKAKADSSHHQESHATVMFRPVEGLNGNVTIYTLSSSGPGIPEISEDAAETDVRLRNAGFQLLPNTGNGWLMVYSR